MKDIPIIFSAPMVRALLEGRKTMTRRLAWRRCIVCGGPGGDCNGPHRPSPWQKVKPGDRLWVREKHSLLESSITGRAAPVWYWADGSIREGDYTFPRPSIHMPRWASRLTLIVTATKIEQLQAITDGDALAEGIAATEFWRDQHPPSICFSVLWNSLHGADSWDANPDVVCVSFKVLKRNIDRIQEIAA